MIKKELKTNTIEVLNALFIVIVLYLHHDNYTINYLKFINELKIDLFLQKFSVGGFIFLSGYKLCSSKLNQPLLSFLKSRFYRIYLLYFLALILFSFSAYPHLYGEKPTLGNFLIHVLCFQSVLPNLLQPNYYTLWFISILFCCYTFFLLFRNKIKNNSFIRYWVFSIISITIVNYISRENGLTIFQEDLNIYLTYFFFGMLYSQYKTHVDSINSKYYICIFLLMFIALTVFSNILYVNTLYEGAVRFFLVMMSTTPVYFILLGKSNDLINNNKIKFFINWISYSSFCVFLFHRSFWAIMSFILPDKPYDFLQWSMIILLGVPLIFIMSIGIQYIYNWCIKTMLFKKTDNIPNL